MNYPTHLPCGQFKCERVILPDTNPHLFYRPRWKVILIPSPLRPITSNPLPCGQSKCERVVLTDTKTHTSLFLWIGRIQAVFALADYYSTVHTLFQCFVLLRFHFGYTRYQPESAKKRKYPTLYSIRCYEHRSI